MGVTPVPLDAAKGMLANGLSAFIILRVLFDVVIIDIHGILVFTSLYDAFGKPGAYGFEAINIVCIFDLINEGFFTNSRYLQCFWTHHS